MARYSAWEGSIEVRDASGEPLSRRAGGASMDGKLFRRAFVERYHLRFNGSRANEDYEASSNYGIEDCSYTGDKDGVLTMHRWFQETECPGPWLSGQFDRLSLEVNDRLR